MDNIINVYEKINIDCAFLQSAIIEAETGKKKSFAFMRKKLVSVCAAMAVLGIVTVLFFRFAVLSPTAFDYDDIIRFQNAGTGQYNLANYDGIAVGIGGVYFNGSEMNIALYGEYYEQQAGESIPDDLRYIYHEGDGAYFLVNGEEAELIDKEIRLVKNQDHFEGTVRLKIENDESFVFLKMSLPSVGVYSKGRFIKTVTAPFDMRYGVARIYAEDEKALMRGDDTLYLSKVVARAPGEIGDYTCGISLSLHVPDDMTSDGMEVKVRLLNEDGSEIPVTMELNGRYTAYDFPDSRYIKAVLYDANQEEFVPLQTYEVHLNDPESPYRFFY